jgi:hypothetical protein
MKPAAQHPAPALLSTERLGSCAGIAVSATSLGRPIDANRFGVIQAHKEVV